MNSRTRPAFTLIELLVVFALLAFAVGLLLPMLQQVRLAASRTQSQNNLKQLGLACHAHGDAYKYMPSGVDANGFSAAAKLLPFIEQEALNKSIKFDVPARAEANDLARKTNIKTFLSPMDPLSETPHTTAPTNYLFSAGSKYALEKNDGVFYRDSKTWFTHITDGTSNTIMIGETLIGSPKVGPKPDVQRQHVELSPNDLGNLNEDSGVQNFADNKNIAGNRCSTWIQGVFLQGTFTATRKLNDSRPDVNCGGTGGLSALRGFQKGINVAMCDGSVRFVSDSIALDTWKAFATRNGGEVVNFP